MPIRKFLAITGVMGAGKSTFSHSLVVNWQKNSLNANPLQIIEVDELRKEIITSNNPQYTSIRKKIAQEFSIEYIGEHYQLDRYSLTQKVFASRNTMNTYNALTSPTFKEAITEKISSGTDDVAIVWSHILEDNFQSIFEDNSLLGLIIYLTLDNETHQKRILAQSQKPNGLPLELILQRINVCCSQEEKLILLEKSHYPNLILNSEKDQDFQKNIQQIISCFPYSQPVRSNRF